MHEKTIKLNWKYRVILASFAGSIFVLALCLLDLTSGVTTRSVYELILEGVIFTIVYGFLFYFLTEKFIPGLKKNIKPELLGNEKIESKARANLFRGTGKIGGELFLTDKRLIFKSHKLNIRKAQTSIRFEEIQDIVKRKTFKIFNNGIRLTATDGKKYDFSIKNRDVWIEKLSKKK